MNIIILLLACVYMDFIQTYIYIYIYSIIHIFIRILCVCPLTKTTCRIYMNIRISQQLSWVISRQNMLPMRYWKTPDVHLFHPRCLGPSQWRFCRSYKTDVMHPWTLPWNLTCDSMLRASWLCIPASSSGFSNPKKNPRHCRISQHSSHRILL